MAFLDKLKWPLSSIAGILVIVFYCIFTFTAAALFPLSWSPFPYLSDFGNSSYSPNGAIFYNLGCILTGLMLFPFFIGLYKYYTKVQWRKILTIVAQVVGLASGFALIMIGVFSEDFMAAHIFWSNVFFLLILFVLILTNISLLTHPKFNKLIAIYGFVVAVIDFVFVVISGGAIIEWFTVFSALIYVAFVVFIMLRAFPKGK
jgi:hypothetical membrane protein